MTALAVAIAAIGFIAIYGGPTRAALARWSVNRTTNDRRHYRWHP